MEDLTEGKTEKILWKFCIPLFGSIIFQQLYNIADSLIAGRFIGENALAAIGNAYQITLVYIAFAFGCNIGCSVVVSQLFGAKKWNELRTAVFTTWIASSVLCVILMLVGITSCDGLLSLIRTPSDIYDSTKLYLNIYVFGFPFLLFYNVANGIFMALGDSKTPFVFLVISSVSNVIVDIIFVKIFNMGVAGVAIATFLCQGVSAVAAMIVVSRRLSEINYSGKPLYFSWEILKKIAVIAIPSILQQSFISVGNIIIQGIINSYGAGVIAGYSTAVKINNLVITSFTTLGNGVSTFSAQNLGAGKLSRIKEGYKAGIKMVWMISVPIILLYLSLSELLIRLFITNPSAEAIHTGIMFLRIVSPFYLVISVKLVADGVLRGVGLMRQFMIATFSDLILRVVLSMIFSNSFGSTGIWCSWPLGWTVATIISVCFYYRFTKSKCDI